MTPNELKKLEDLLRRECGSNPFGESMYKWVWSETHMHLMVVVDRQGKMVFDWAPSESGLLVPKGRTKFRKQAHWLKDRWAMARWHTFTPEEWGAQYGNAIPHNPRGEFIIQNVALDPGEEPTLAITEDFIQRWKADRKKSLEDWNAQSEGALDSKERDSDDKIAGKIDDVCTVYSSHPGNAHDPLPSVPFSKNYDNVFSKETTQ